jgi:YVTN family beta-propeller protein
VPQFGQVTPPPGSKDPWIVQRVAQAFVDEHRNARAIARMQPSDAFASGVQIACAMKVDPRIGTELGGYRLEELIGQGGMGAVYLAEDVRLGRKVALKLLAPDMAEDERFRERFVRESRMAAGLEHPNIVPIYEAGEADGVLFIAMRYIRGTDLKATIRSDGALAPARALRLLGQVADALDTAHSEGLVHRDVKPANILIAPPPVPGASEHAYLSDFGLTKRVSSDSGITATGQFVGTLDYAAPEQFEGKPLDGRTDVYSLACVLFECLTGEAPYARDQEAAVMYAHLMAPVPSPTEKNPQLPAAIDEVIVRGMAKSPEQRFATAGALIREARAALRIADEDVEARPSGEGPAERAALPGARPRLPIPLLAAAAAAVIVVAGVAFALTRGGGGTPRPGGTSTRVAIPAGKAGVAAFDAKTSKPEGGVALGEGTGTLTVGFGSVWVANQDEDSVSRIDPKTHKVVATINVGNRPNAIAVGEGDPHVWVITSDGVWGIDPLTNGVVATIKLANLPLGLAVAQGGVWVTYKINDPSPEGLYRIDPSSRTVAERIHVAEATFAPSPIGVAVTPEAAWVVTPGVQVGTSGGFLTRWDLTARKRTQQGIGTPSGLSAGSDSVWVLQADGIVLRVDPATSEVVARIGTATGATAIFAGDEAVWVVHRQRGILTRIDPATNQADTPIHLDGKPSSVAVGDGLVWVRLDGES